MCAFLYNELQIYTQKHCLTVIFMQMHFDHTKDAITVSHISCNKY